MVVVCTNYANVLERSPVIYLYQLFRDILARDHHHQNELLLCIQWILFCKEAPKIKTAVLCHHLGH